MPRGDDRKVDRGVDREGLKVCMYIHTYIHNTDKARARARARACYVSTRFLAIYMPVISMSMQYLTLLWTLNIMTKTRH